MVWHIFKLGNPTDSQTLHLIQAAMCFSADLSTSTLLHFVLGPFECPNVTLMVTRYIIFLYIFVFIRLQSIHVMRDQYFRE